MFGQKGDEGPRGFPGPPGPIGLQVSTSHTCLCSIPVCTIQNKQNNSPSFITFIVALFCSSATQQLVFC